MSEKCASHYLASEAEDDSASRLYSKAVDFAEFALEWWDDFALLPHLENSIKNLNYLKMENQYSGK